MGSPRQLALKVREEVSRLGSLKSAVVREIDVIVTPDDPKSTQVRTLPGSTKTTRMVTPATPGKTTQVAGVIVSTGRPAKSTQVIVTPIHQYWCHSDTSPCVIVSILLQYALCASGAVEYTVLYDLH